ncbi:MAG: hypothetical protein IJO45_01115 [Oscillospiraceae bacterium]|nr:hypothetical protein [Oscillospiraceae bacterium]
MKKGVLIAIVVVLAILLIGLVFVALMPGLNIGVEKETQPDISETIQTEDIQAGAEEEENAQEEETVPQVEDEEIIIEPSPDDPTISLPFIPYDDPTEAPTQPGNAEEPASPTEAPTEAPTEPVETIPPATMPGGETYPPNMTPLY